MTYSRSNHHNIMHTADIKATPHGWQPGGEVVVKPSISTEDAKKMFPKINVVKPYLRLIPQPK